MIAYRIQLTSLDLNNLCCQLITFVCNNFLASNLSTNNHFPTLYSSYEGSHVFAKKYVSFEWNNVPAQTRQPMVFSVIQCRPDIIDMKEVDKLVSPDGGADLILEPGLSGMK